MSALWTTSRGTDRLCRGMVAEPDSHLGVGCTFPCTGAFRLACRGPEVMVQRQLRPPHAPSRPMCTRVGLNWSGVVRTARSHGKPL